MLRMSQISLKAPGAELALQRYQSVGLFRHTARLTGKPTVESRSTAVGHLIKAPFALKFPRHPCKRWKSHKFVVCGK